jgi:hypothetical protein
VGGEKMKRELEIKGKEGRWKEEREGMERSNPAKKANPSNMDH